MKKFFLYYLYMLRIICLFILLFNVILSAEEVADIQWYTDGQNLLQIEPVGFKSSSYLSIKGTTSCKNILLIIKKEKNEDRYLIKPKEIFDVTFLLPFGKGLYDIQIFGNRDESLSYKGIAFFKIFCTNEFFEELEIGDRVVEEAKKSLGLKIGRGECWDLVQEILDREGARWKRPVEFGKKIDLATQDAKPGDIIQMYSIVIQYSNRIEYFGAPQHTAIIVSVESKSNFTLLHQNIAGKRYVTYGNIDLTRKKSGRFEIYRPVKGLWNRF